MKLYTEEQVKTMLHLADLKHMDDQSIRVYTDKELFKSVIPIELPNTDEIERDLFPLTTDFDAGFLAGGKYVIKQIKQRADERAKL